MEQLSIAEDSGVKKKEKNYPVPAYLVCKFLVAKHCVTSASSSITKAK